MKRVHAIAGSGLFPSSLHLNLNSSDAERMREHMREQAAFCSKQFGRGEFYRVFQMRPWSGIFVIRAASPGSTVAYLGSCRAQPEEARYL